MYGETDRRADGPPSFGLVMAAGGGESRGTSANDPDDDRDAVPRDARTLTLALDRDSAVPLYRQIYLEIRKAILAQRLVPGAKLPSTRGLCAELGVSRNTVLAAFQQLETEGFIEGRLGAGTWVAVSLPQDLLAERGRRSGRPHRPSPLARRVAELARLTRPIGAAVGKDLAFTPALPAIDAFPRRLWLRLLSRCARRLVGRSGQTDPAGYGPLRRAIADYVGAARGVVCSADQVVVTAGAQQALDLAARMLVDPGATACVEDPGYPGAVGALLDCDARLVAVPVDEQGVSVDALRALPADVRAVYVSPSHQFPLGVSMTLARRLALLEWASTSRSWIIEDDYDAEFRYGRQPVTALRGLDADDRVWYIGTFSKTLFPGLRLGYLVVPEGAVDETIAVRVQLDLYPAPLLQAVVAEFMAEGHFARHLRRMRVLYGRRRQALLDAGRRELAGLLELQADDTGMRLVGWLPPGVDDRLAAVAAAAHRVETLPLSMFYRDHAPRRPGLVLSYGATSEDGIESAVRRLREALEEIVSRRSDATVNG